jgi:hypothetical protein
VTIFNSILNTRDEPFHFNKHELVRAGSLAIVHYYRASLYKHPEGTQFDDFFQADQYDEPTNDFPTP